MAILVTGSAGHLGEALIRTLNHQNRDVVGIDRVDSKFTDHVGTITDRSFVRQVMNEIDVVLHTATLHKPHIATHSRQEFVDVNVTGTLHLLEESIAAGVQSFVFTSSTSTFGDALTPKQEAPAVWVTEDLIPQPKNIYGATKVAAEDLCHLFHRNQQLPCIVLKASRFFPEMDDRKDVREDYEDSNSKANEFLYRRADVEDVVDAHLLAAEKAKSIGFGRYIISATTPFLAEDVLELRSNAPQVLRKRVPQYEAEYAHRGWRMLPSVDRVYVNERARSELGWQPKHNFTDVLDRLRRGGEVLSPTASLIGKKGYHSVEFSEGPYPVESTE